MSVVLKSLKIVANLRSLYLDIIFHQLHIFLGQVMEGVPARVIPGINQHQVVGGIDGTLEGGRNTIRHS